jgi:hypothetical protein
MSMEEEVNRTTPLVDRVNEAIRENPLAAGLIGAGVVWALFGAKGFGAVGFAKRAGGKLASAAANAGTAAATAGSTALRAGANAAAAVKAAASDATEASASIVPEHLNADPSSIYDGGHRCGDGGR